MDCIQLPELGYSEFSRALHNKAFAERIPLAGSLELTQRCNLNCAHCYVNLSASDGQARARELPTAETIRILGEAAEAGTMWLLITGGEPLIRPDFAEIYQFAKKQGFLLTIFTNGTTLTPGIADMLAEWPPFSVEVTLYGKTQKVYERITGVPGSFGRCMKGIEFLRERNLPLKLKSTVVTLNRHQIWDMQAFADSLDVEFRFDAVVNPRLDGTETLEDLRLSPEAVVELDLADAKRAESWVEVWRKFPGPPDSTHLYQCGAGKTTFNIDPYGILSGCVISRSPHRSLRAEPFSKAWKALASEIDGLKRTRQSDCNNCEISIFCDHCPGWALLEHGDDQHPVEYLCRIAHLRYDGFKPRLMKAAT